MTPARPTSIDLVVDASAILALALDESTAHAIQAVLESADGRPFQVLATQLSAADQAYLKEQGLAPTAPAPGPTIPMPRIRCFFGSTMILVIPSVRASV